MIPTVVSKLLIASRGNHDTITKFLLSLKDEKMKNIGIDLLNVISSKDLRDVSIDVLYDNFNEYKGGSVEYVLNPRVSNEMLTPYKSFFKNVFSVEEYERFKKDPDSLVEYVSKNITVNDSCNLGGAPISPIGVWKTRIADSHSRDIFFVALARSLDIPARIDEVTGKVQLMMNDIKDVTFTDNEKDVIMPKGELVAGYKPTKMLKDPKYYSHFTISELDNECRMKLLNHDEGDVDMGDGTTWSGLLKNGTMLDKGNYVMVTGMRLANGGVLADISFFNVEAAKRKCVNLVMRDRSSEVEVIGNFNSESLYKPIGSNARKSILSTTGRGYYILGILGVGQEPTNHALRDVVQLASDFNNWNRKMIFLFSDEAQYRKFNATDFKGLPDIIEYGTDNNDEIKNQVVQQLKLAGNGVLPIFIIADTFNRVVFVSQGYTIGLGEQMMNVIKKLSN